MRNPIFSKSPSGLKFVISLLIIIFTFFIFLFLGILFFSIFFDHSVFSHIGTYSVLDENNPLSISFAKTSQIFQSLGLFVVPGILIAFLFSNNTWRYLGFSKHINYKILLSAGIIMLIALPLVNFTAEINQKLTLPESLKWLENLMRQSEERAGNITNLFLAVNTFSGFLINLFMMALIPAFGEEIMFRGLIQKNLSKKMNVHIAIFISAFIFSSVHFQFFGFLPRFLMGLFFGYLFSWTNNLWYNIFAHFINNGTAVLVAYIQGVEATDPGDGFGSMSSLYVILSFILTAGIIYFIYRENKIKRYS